MPMSFLRQALLARNGYELCAKLAASIVSAHLLVVQGKKVFSINYFFDLSYYASVGFSTVIAWLVLAYIAYCSFQIFKVKADLFNYGQVAKQLGFGLLGGTLLAVFLAYVLFNLYGYSI